MNEYQVTWKFNIRVRRDTTGGVMKVMARDERQACFAAKDVVRRTHLVGREYIEVVGIELVGEN